MNANLLPIVWGFVGGISFMCAKYQLNEKKYKQEYVEMIDNRISSKPMDCPGELTKEQIDKEYEYKRVSVKGYIDHRNTFILGPRKPPDSTPFYKILNPNSWGSYIYSALETATGHIIIINRGWVPKNMVKQYHVIEDPKINYREYEGVISSPKNPGLFDIDSDKSIINSTTWQFRDYKLLKAKKVVQKHFVVVDILEPKQEYGEYPHRLTKSDICGMIHTPPQQHLTYAMTFVTTGVICCGVAFILWRHPHVFHKMHMHHTHK
eukprot:280108_1